MQKKIKSEISSKTIISRLCDIDRDFFYPKLRLELIRLVNALPKAQKVVIELIINVDYSDYEKSCSIEDWQAINQHGDCIGTRFKFNEKALYELLEKEVTCNWREAWGGDVSIVINLADMTIHLESRFEKFYPGDNKTVSIG
jgi:hypothetical protein